MSAPIAVGARVRVRQDRADVRSGHEGVVIKRRWITPFNGRAGYWLLWVEMDPGRRSWGQPGFIRAERELEVVR